MKTVYYILGSILIGFVSYKIYTTYYQENEPTQEDKEARKIIFKRK
jgi:uncharacterized membrane protein YebE (DUF533 family)